VHPNATAACSVFRLILFVIENSLASLCVIGLVSGGLFRGIQIIHGYPIKHSYRFFLSAQVLLKADPQAATIPAK
jgi:hypothetical protein